MKKRMEELQRAWSQQMQFRGQAARDLERADRELAKIEAALVELQTLSNQEATA